MSKDKKDNLATALIAAQSEIKGAKKDTNNPFFKKKYADLTSVIEACGDALNKHGIAYIQPYNRDDRGDYCDTIFMHESGDTISSRIYLVVGKNDMQGLGSAMTYARRYGLMGLAGVAPEDDDGNAAAKSPQETSPAKADTITADEFMTIKNKMEEKGVAETKILDALGVKSLEEIASKDFPSVMKRLNAAPKPEKKPPVDGDEIPY